MARPVKVRRVCEEPKYTRFMPVGSDKYDAVVLSIEEFEVMRHVDYQKMTHEECARHMAISRTTATELYESARAKIADSLINGKVLCIEGGNYKVCEGADIKEGLSIHGADVRGYKIYIKRWIRN